MNYAVGVVFKARDLVSPALQHMGKNTGRFSRYSQGEFAKLSKSVMSYSKLVGSILSAKVISRGFAYMEMGVGAVADEYLRMDQNLSAASAKFGVFYQKGHKGWVEMTKAAQKYGGTTEYTNAQVAQGFDELAKAGLTFTQANAAMPQILNFATAAHTELAEAVLTNVDALGAFGMSKAPDKIAENMQRVGDVLAKTANTSTTNVSELSEAMSQSAPHIRRSGADLETWAAMAGTMAKAGLKGSVAATGLKNMILRVSAPGKKVVKILQELGVAVSNPKTGKLRDMLDILADIGKSVSKFDDLKQNQVFRQLFGMRGVGAAGATFGKNLAEGLTHIKTYRAELKGSTGEAQKVADITRKGLEIQVATLKSVAMNRGFEVINKLIGNKGAEDQIATLIKWTREVDLNPVVEQMRNLGAVIKEIATTLYDHRELIKWFFMGRFASKIGKMALEFGSMAVNMGKWARELGKAAVLAKRLQDAQAAGGFSSVLGKVGSSVPAGASAPMVYRAGGAVTVGELAGAGVGGLVAIASAVVTALVAGGIVGTIMSHMWQDKQAEELNRENKLYRYNTARMAGSFEKEDTATLRQKYYDAVATYQSLNHKYTGLGADRFKEMKTESSGTVMALYQILRERELEQNGYVKNTGSQPWVTQKQTVQPEVKVRVDVHGPEGITAEARLDDSAPRGIFEEMYDATYGKVADWVRGY